MPSSRFNLVRWPVQCPSSCKAVAANSGGPRKASSGGELDVIGSQARRRGFACLSLLESGVPCQRFPARNPSAPASAPQVPLWETWPHSERIPPVKRHRSEERRVGKECRSRWSRDDQKKNE